VSENDSEQRGNVDFAFEAMRYQKKTALLVMILGLLLQGMMV
jgi:hypothetical protein